MARRIEDGRMMKCGIFRNIRLAIGGILLAALAANAGNSAPPPAIGANSSAGHAERARLLDSFSNDGADALPILLEALDDERPFVRRTAAHLIVRLGSEAQGGIGQVLKSPDFQVRRIAINGIAAQQRLPEFWATILQDPHPSIRRDIRYDLVPQYVDEAMLVELLGEFEEAYQNGDPAVRLDIIYILTDLAAEYDAVIDLLTTASRDPDEEVRTVAFGVVIAPTMERIEQYVDALEWQALVDQYGDSDFSAWPDRELARRAFFMRGRAWFLLRQGERARDDLASSVAISPDRATLVLKAQNAVQFLDDPQRALELYLEAIETPVGFGGYLLYTAILGAANRYRADERYEESIAVIERVNPDSMGGYWGAMMQDALAQTLVAQGHKKEAAERYQRALALDGVAESLRDRLQRQLDELGEDPES